MRMSTTALVIVVIASTSRPLNAEDAPKKSAEHQVLERFIGNWETEITVKPSGDKYNTTESRKWSKEGKVVISEDMNLASKREAHFLVTYDPGIKSYRACFFDEGTTLALLGAWNNETQTMRWTGTDANGAKLSGENHFIDKDHVEWTLTVIGPDDKIIVELAAKQTRKK